MDCLVGISNYLSHEFCCSRAVMLINPAERNYFLLPKNPRFFFSPPSSFEYLLFFSSFPLLDAASFTLDPFNWIGRPLPLFMLIAAKPAVGGFEADRS